MANIPDNSKEEMRGRAGLLSSECYFLEYGNKRIKELLDYYGSSYKQLKAAAKEQFIKDMMAEGMTGARIPDDVPLSDELQMQWNDIVESIRSEIKGIISLRYDTINKAITDAPSTDALNSIMLLNMRKNVKEEDITALMERYGKNPQCFYAIRDIAQAHELYWSGSNGIVEQYENLKIFDDNIQKISSNIIMDDGLKGIYKMKVDEVFTPDNAIRPYDTIDNNAEEA